MPKGNLLYIQGGGPTSVINQTLAGVCVAARDKFSYIMGAKHGIEGLINEDFYNLQAATAENIAENPSAGLGTSRVELRGQREDVLKRAVDVIKAHDITHLITNGGEDTAETALVLYVEAWNRGRKLNIVHAPKTIDNDLPGNHHCPGFGTAARYVALTAAGNYLDAKACKHVKIDVTMGRDTGWLTAATALARDKVGEGPHAIFVPEHDASLDDILKSVQDAYRKHGFAHVVISEGYGEKFVTKNSSELSADFALETFLHGVISENVTKKVRVDKYGYTQRSTFLASSPLDSKHASDVGWKAVEYVQQFDAPTMAAVLDSALHAEIKPVHLSDVVTPGYKRRAKLWSEFLGPPGEINDSYFRYARPLTGHIRRISEMRDVHIEKKLPPFKEY